MEKWTKCWKCYWHEQCSSEKPCSDYTPICDDDEGEDNPEERERFAQEWHELLEEVEFFNRTNQFIPHVEVCEWQNNRHPTDTYSRSQRRDYAKRSGIYS